MAHQPHSPRKTAETASRHPLEFLRGPEEAYARRPARRVLVLHADLGHGHRAAANALAADLESSDTSSEVSLEDGLAALGRPLRIAIRDGSLLQFRRIPWAFGPIYGSLMGAGTVRLAARAALSLFGARRLLRVIEAHNPDVVVSTYPGINSVLGELRRAGRLHAPVCTTVLDFASLPFWTHPGIDLHLVMHEESVEAVRRLGAGAEVQHVRPLVNRSFYEPCSRMQARETLMLPSEGRLVLVTGGGWGIGDPNGAVRAALRVRRTRVICVAGNNDRVRRRLELEFEGEPRVVILGFTERMRLLMAAADVIVHSAGGVTCLEALVCGRPALVYGAPPGHWRANAKRMEEAGLTRVVRTEAALPAALRVILDAPEDISRNLPGVSSAEAVLALAANGPQPNTAWRGGRLAGTELPASARGRFERPTRVSTRRYLAAHQRGSRTVPRASARSGP